MSEKVRKKTGVNPSTPGTSMATTDDQRRLSRGFDTIFDQFRSSFDDLITPFFPTLGIRTIPLIEIATRYPSVDLIDKGDKYTVIAELPGFNKDMVDVQVNKDNLQIKAEKKTEKKEDRKNYMHRERAYAAFERTITFPEKVDPSKVRGAMKHGVLELTIPKKEPKPEERMTKVSVK